MSASVLQQLKSLTWDFDDLATILNQIENNPQAQASLPAFLTSCADTQVEQWCTHCLDMLPANVGCILITAVPPEQKEALQKSSDIRMQVALIGEYGAQEWIDVLKKHWPEIINLCLDNAVQIFEKHAAEEKKWTGSMPNIMKDVLVTCIQEKVLRNYIDFLTSDQFTRYFEANAKNNRESDPVLRSHHQHMLLTQATQELGCVSLRRIKI